MSEAQRNVAFTRLATAKLLTLNRHAAGTLVSLDAHPLLREYFARQLRTQQPEAWRAAHGRLYEQLCATTKEGTQPTLEDLQPLYQAVAHGCQAGLQQEAHDDVYWRRVRRGREEYSTAKLGAFGSELGAEACFFDKPWSEPSPNLCERDQIILLGNAAFDLRAVGRLTESLEPMRAAVLRISKVEEWEQAAVAASNLSELELTLGEVAGAVGDAEQSVTYADRSGDAFWRRVSRVQHGNMLHQAGRQDNANELFREAERMQGESEPNSPLLYSHQGFLYCDLFLTEAERAAWQAIQRSGVRSQKSELVGACRAVEQRAAQMIKIAERNNRLLDIALGHLTLGRSTLYAAILEKSEIRNSKSQIDQAVDGLRRAGNMDDLPRGLLTRAWCSFAEATEHRLHGRQKQTAECEKSAQSDLDEAWDIAERGPMPLLTADIHLHRARLFGLRIADRELRIEEAAYPWTSPEHDLHEARRLIEKHGYLRRMEELEDAEEAMLR